MSDATETIQPDDLQAELERLQALLQQKDSELAKQSFLLNQKQFQLKKKDQQLKQQQEKLSQKETLLKDREQSIEEHQRKITRRDSTIQSLEQEVAYLNERLQVLLSKRYQAQSETLKSIQGQLFDEAELEQAIQEAQAELEQVQQQLSSGPSNDTSDTHKNERQQPKRKALPSHFKRVEIVLDVCEEEKQQMGEDWEFIGYETSEQLAVQQRQYYVKHFKRKKYVRKQRVDDQTTEQAADTLRVAPPAKAMLPKSIADATLLADVITSKFVDAMSFYRTHKRLKREGIDIGYSTLCDWPIQLYQQLERLYQLLHIELARSSLWHLDETTLQVLGEPGRENQNKSYLWGLRGGPPDKPIIVFHYNERRNYEALDSWLQPLLEEFSGIIVTDEHGAYNRLSAKCPGIKGHGGCWAHARRKFSDAAKGRRNGSEAHKVLQKIALLYRLDGKTSHLSGKEKLLAREEIVKPHLDKLKEYLDTLAAKYLNKGYFNKALRYTLNHWDKLTAFLDHAEMPLDNNPIEQSFRPFTVGRNYPRVGIMHGF